MGRLRIALLTLLALAVPPFALGGEQGSPQPAALSVSASLGGCGLADAAITCRIDSSWNAIEGADYYTVSVTRPDGSVIDLGQTPSTSRSLYVSYVGPGRYSVQVAAWGTPPGEGDDGDGDEKAEVLDRDRATPREQASRTGSGNRGANAEGGEDSAGDAGEQASGQVQTEDQAAPAAPASAPQQGQPAPETDEADAEVGTDPGSAVRSSECQPQPQKPCPPQPGSS